MRLNIRFKYWMLATTAVLVLLLTGLFLTTVFGKFSRLAEESARERSTLVTQHAVSEISALAGDAARDVAIFSQSPRSTFVVAGEEGGKLNPETLVAPLMASLEVNPRLYGHYFGLDNDDFLQVIGVRGESRIATSLQAPATTYFAVRRIERQSERTEHWQFFDRARHLLGERASEASYAPTSRPWYLGAQRENRLFLTDPYLFASTG